MQAVSRFSAITTKRAHYPQTHTPEAISRNCSRLLFTCRTAVPHNSGLLFGLAGNNANDDQQHDKKLVSALKLLRCRTGTPDKVWTDQGPQFTSQAFQKFCKTMGLRTCHLITKVSSKYGKAEATVMSMKKII